MTVLVLAFAFDCLATMLVGGWKAGSPGAWQRSATTCEIRFAGWQPEMQSWCDYLGPSRCAVRVEPEKEWAR